MICHQVQPVHRLFKPRESKDLPLSYAQQRLWLLDKIDGGSAHYNVPSALRLTGRLDVDALTQAFNTLLSRHEVLRTCFAADDIGEPVQLIRSATVLDIPLTDISSIPEDEREVALSRLVSQESSKPFDLSKDRMLRVQLIRVSADEHVLLATMHHIASDGWSIGILITEFSALYTSYTQGQDNPLPELSIQYADYAQWQRDWLQGEVLSEQIRVLGGAISGYTGGTRFTTGQPTTPGTKLYRGSLP